VKLTELFIEDMERERDKTRKAVAAVPEGKGDWKPHDKAMPFGRLAGLVAQMPSWIAMMIDAGGTDEGGRRRIRRCKESALGHNG